MSDRDARDRIADHAVIERLADGLIPALAAELEAGGLGELEVRDADWRIRLRGRLALDEMQLAAASAAVADPGTGRQAPSAQGQAPEAYRGQHTSSSYTPGAVRTDGEPTRVPTTSPAVGIFLPVSGVAAGSRVRKGDTVGTVDVLGIARDVIAPADGILGAMLAEPGQAVEFGQELTWIVPADYARASRRSGEQPSR